MRRFASLTFQIPAALYLSGFFVLFLCAADIYLSKQGLLPLRPTLLCVLLMLPLVAAATLRDLLCERPLACAITVFRRNALILIFFVLLVMTSLLLSLHPTSYWRENARWIFLYLYDFAIVLLAMLLPLNRTVQKAFPWFAFAGLAALLASLVFDLLYPGTFSTVISRAAGFPENSNMAALTLVMLASAALRYGARGARLGDISVLSLTGLGVFVTLSRSGILVYFVLLSAYVYFAFVARGSGLKSAFTFICTAVILVLIFLVSIPLIVEESEMFSLYTAKARIAAFSGKRSIIDASGTSRLSAADEAFRLINKSPIIGHGTGFSRRMDELPHNMYLQQWVNNGLIGLFAYVGLLLISFWIFTRRKFAPGQTFIAIIMLASIFSHTILDQRPFLLLFGCFMTLSLHPGRRE